MMAEDELYPTPDEYDDYTMKESPTYTPPKVWQWDQDGEENRFSKLTVRRAQPTRTSQLASILYFYSLATPNGVKVTVMLEELLMGIREAEYDAWLVNIMEGDQFSGGFVSANPNSKIPALIDHSTPAPTRVFESAAIVVYLAEKYGQFLPTEVSARQVSFLGVLANGQHALLGGASGIFTPTRQSDGVPH